MGGGEGWFSWLSSFKARLTFGRRCTRRPQRGRQRQPSGDIIAARNHAAVPPGAARRPRGLSLPRLTGLYICCVCISVVQGSQFGESSISGSVFHSPRSPVAAPYALEGAFSLGGAPTVLRIHVSHARYCSRWIARARVGASASEPNSHQWIRGSDEAEPDRCSRCARGLRPQRLCTISWPLKNATVEYNSTLMGDAGAR